MDSTAFYPEGSQASPGPPSELAAFEQGSYEDVQKELTATVREMAIRQRRKQTMQQLEQLQSNEPEILRLRRCPSNEIAELDSELVEPAELPGCEVRALSLVSGSCAYELDALSDPHEPEQGYRPVSKIAQPDNPRTEAPFSDLELVGDLVAGGHIELPPSKLSSSDVSHGAQDTRPRDLVYISPGDKVALGSYDGNLTEGDSSTSWGNSKTQSNYTTNLTNRGPTDPGVRQQHDPSPQVHSRNPSGSVTLPTWDREHECQSLFTDLDTLVKALPARKSCRQRR
ncbi:MAG: hypothetical protein Q9169_001189 [Polycauliona sp. 2 TL-2023]